MNTEGQKHSTISNAAGTASTSPPASKTSLTELEEKIAGDNASKPLESLQMSDIRYAPNADRSTKTTPRNDASSQQAVRIYARQSLQSLTHSLNVLAKTVQEKTADWKAQIIARRRSRELARDRSRLLIYSLESQNQ